MKDSFPTLLSVLLILLTFGIFSEMHQTDVGVRRFIEPPAAIEEARDESEEEDDEPQPLRLEELMITHHKTQSPEHTTPEALP